MTIRVIVLNGGSSSGKSSLARALQVELAGYWLRLGVDTLIDAAPPRLLTAGDGLVLSDSGNVTPGPVFREVEDQWMQGIAAVATAGGHVIIEDGFVSGPPSQRRWRDALGDIATGWVAVRCPADVASARERTRADRVPGMAARQAEAVHEGIEYDIQVDTSTAQPQQLATAIRQHFQLTPAVPR